ncbi:hypothetical protein [Kitasatospora sp. NPDC056184]|uniref:hypothetical protein n=1 Tax=Kitasatospora sp. NPDC056184 TaxID=3345738 RepID=UPI0035D9232F
MIDRLVLQLPDLSARHGARRIDWSALSDGLGIDFPSDYKVLAERYATFSVDEFILVSTPASGAEVDFISDIKFAWEIMEDDVAEGDVPADYLIRNSEGLERAALLQWGGTPDGDQILWGTASPDPNEWPVVFRSRSGGWWSYSEGLVAFLEGFYSGRISVPGLPQSLRRGPRKVSFHSF